jgi:hypothetical protein
MKRSDTQCPNDDATMPIVETLNDGSLAGLATYHLVRRQLLEIRGLPETRGPSISQMSGRRRLIP